MGRAGCPGAGAVQQVSPLTGLRRRGRSLASLCGGGGLGVHAAPTLRGACRGVEAAQRCVRMWVLRGQPLPAGGGSLTAPFVRANLSLPQLHCSRGCNAVREPSRARPRFPLRTPLLQLSTTHPAWSVCLWQHHGREV